MSLLVEKSEAKTTRNGKAFLGLSLRDEGGSIRCNLWDYDPARHAHVKEGLVVEVDGIIEDYQGTMQLKLNSIAPSAKSADLFAKRTRFDVETMWKELVDTVGTFKEPLTRFVAEEILLKHAEFIAAYKRAPAARIVHNAYYGGLLEHVWSLCQIAEPVIKHYQGHYCDKISRDKVLFGLLLHDAGKIVEYDYNVPTFPYTPIGVFTNHMVLGPAWVFETANKYPAKGPDFKMERSHLMHVLAAHHGQIEWGSPVAPASIEAILVHHLDNLDSKVMHALALIEGKPGPIVGFSERSFFEKTQYLVPK